MANSPNQSNGDRCPRSLPIALGVCHLTTEKRIRDNLSFALYPRDRECLDSLRSKLGVALGAEGIMKDVDILRWCLRFCDAKINPQKCVVATDASDLSSPEASTT